MAQKLNELENTCDKTSDLGGVFDSTDQPIFWDKVHTNDLGNEILSEKFYELVTPIILEQNKTSYLK